MSRKLAPKTQKAIGSAFIDSGTLCGVTKVADNDSLPLLTATLGSDGKLPTNFPVPLAPLNLHSPAVIVKFASVDVVKSLPFLSIVLVPFKVPTNLSLPSPKNVILPG